MAVSEVLSRREDIRIFFFACKLKLTQKFLLAIYVSGLLLSNRGRKSPTEKLVDERVYAEEVDGLRRERERGSIDALAVVVAVLRVKDMRSPVSKGRVGQVHVVVDEVE